MKKKEEISHIRRIVKNRLEIVDFTETSLVERFDLLVENILNNSDKRVKRNLIDELSYLKTDVFTLWLLKNWNWEEYGKLVADEDVFKRVLSGKRKQKVIYIN